MVEKVTPRYGYLRHLSHRGFGETKTQVIEALKQEGFGVLTEIDVQATLKQKINQDFRAYVILGACNPHLAHQALQADLNIGLLLPCNVCLWEDDHGVTVAIARPDVMFEVVRNPAMDALVRDVNDRVRRVLAAIV